jgi:O-antigen/teichoic acid export membrane protein
VASGLLADVLRGFRDIRAATIQTEILILWLGLVGVLALSAAVPPLTVEGVVCALAVGALGATTFGAWALARHLRGLPEPAAAPPAPWWREQSGPIWLNTGLWLVFGQMDLWVLGVFRAPAEVAVYGVASRVAILLNQPEVMARAVLMPRIAALHAQGDLGALQRMVRGAATLSTALASAGALGLALGGGWALAAVFGKPYRACLPVLLILAGGYVLSAAAGLAATTLLMTGNQRAVLRGSLVGSSFTFALLLVLTPAFGAVGAATASALGFALQNALMLGLARRLLGIWTFLAVRPGEWRATWRAAQAAPAGPGVS